MTYALKFDETGPDVVAAADAQIDAAADIPPAVKSAAKEMVGSLALGPHQHLAVDIKGEVNATGGGLAASVNTHTD